MLVEQVAALLPRPWTAPRGRPVGGQLSDQQREYNQRISAIPAPIERAMANLKAWRILHTDYRRPLHTYDDALHAAIGPLPASLG